MNFDIHTSGVIRPNVLLIAVPSATPSYVSRADGALGLSFMTLDAHSSAWEDLAAILSEMLSLVSQRPTRGDNTRGIDLTLSLDSSY